MDTKLNVPSIFISFYLNKNKHSIKIFINSLIFVIVLNSSFVTYLLYTFSATIDNMNKMKHTEFILSIS